MVTGRGRSTPCVVLQDGRLLFGSKVGTEASVGGMENALRQLGMVSATAIVSSVAVALTCSIYLLFSHTVMTSRNKMPPRQDTEPPNAQAAEFESATPPPKSNLLSNRR